MKLPGEVNVGVQSLGRLDIEAESAVARTLAEVASGIAQISADQYARYKKDQTQSQQRQASLEMTRQVVAFEERYGNKKFFTADEVPDHIQVRRTDKVVNDDGTISEVPRETIPAYEVYPQMYRTYTQNYMQAAAVTIDDTEARNGWSASTEQTILGNYMGKLAGAKEEQDKFLTEQLFLEIDSAVQANQYDVARALTDDIKDDNTREKALKQIDFIQEDSIYNNLVMSPVTGPEDLRVVEDTIEHLMSPDYIGNLTDSQRMAKVNALNSTADRWYAEIRAKQERQRQELVSDTWLAIDEFDPNVDESYVDGMFDNEKIDGGTRTAMIRAIRKNREDAVNGEAIKADLDAIALAGYGIDPKDKPLREAVNARYEEYVKANNDPMQSAVRIMREFKVVPDAIQSMFRANNRADAGSLAQASELWNYAEDYAPQSLKDFRDSEVDVVRAVGANVRLGMSPVQAVDSYNKWQALTPQQKQALSAQSKEMRDNNSTVLKGLVNDAYSEWYDAIPFVNTVPELPAFMQTEFDAKVQKHLPSVGFDLAVAQRMAFGDIRRRWAKTEINGDTELMPNAPMGPREQIREAIDSTYADRIAELKAATGYEIDPSKVRIIPDQLTELELNNGKLPSYQAFIVLDHETGEVEQLPRFTWDATKAAEQRRSKILEEARIEREKMQQIRKSMVESGELSRQRREELSQGVSDVVGILGGMTSPSRGKQKAAQMDKEQKARDAKRAEFKQKLDKKLGKDVDI